MLFRSREVHADVADLTQQAHRAEAPWRDRRQRGFRFEVGAKVWLYTAKKVVGQSSKLDAQRWTGPWTVEARISDCVYKVKRAGSDDVQVISVDRLRPYYELDSTRFPRDSDSEAETSCDESSDSVDEGDTPPPSEIMQPDADALDEPDRTARDDVTVTVTSRAQRHRRPPARLRDYVMCSE